MTLSEKIGHLMVPLGTHGIYAEGNMVNISPTIMINISWIPGKIENNYIDGDFSPEEIQTYTDLFKEFHKVFTRSYEKMPRIVPCVIEHEIKTYPIVNLVPRAMPLRNMYHDADLVRMVVLTLNFILSLKGVLFCKIHN